MGNTRRADCPDARRIQRLSEPEVVVPENLQILDVEFRGKAEASQVKNLGVSRANQELPTTPRLHLRSAVSGLHQEAACDRLCNPVDQARAQLWTGFIGFFVKGIPRHADIAGLRPGPEMTLKVWFLGITTQNISRSPRLADHVRGWNGWVPRVHSDSVSGLLLSP